MSDLVIGQRGALVEYVSGSSGTSPTDGYGATWNVFRILRTISETHGNTFWKLRAVSESVRVTWKCISDALDSKSGLGLLGMCFGPSGPSLTPTVNRVTWNTLRDPPDHRRSHAGIHFGSSGTCLTQRVRVTQNAFRKLWLLSNLGLGFSHRRFKLETVPSRFRPALNVSPDRTRMLFHYYLLLLILIFKF